MAGGAGYADEGGDGLIADINVTPLVDIVLVLLIVFMIVVPTIVNNPSIKVDLPHASNVDTTPKSTLALTLTRTDAGYDLYLNGEKTDETQLRVLIPKMQTEKRDLQAIIAADKGISYGDVIHIVDLVKSLGILKFALNTDPT